MTLFLFCLIVGINFFSSYLKKNSKFVLWMSIIGIAVLMCGYRRPFHGDLDNYQFMFEGKMDVTVGLGIIFSFAKKIGLSFWCVHYSIIVILLLTIVYIIKKYSYNWHFPLACFASYYIIISSDQIKNHTALIFFLLAIVALYNEKKILFTFLIIIAASIHYSFAIYIILLLIYNKKKKFITQIIVISALIISLFEIMGVGDILFYFISKADGFIENYLGSYALLKLQSYIGRRTGLGYLLLFLFQIINYYLLFVCEKWLPKTRKIDDVRKITVFVKNINVIGFICFPLFIYNQQWYRLIRELLVVNYCVYGNCYYLLPRHSRKGKILFCLTIINISIWFVGDLIMKSEMTSVMIPFFTNNLFLN